MSHIDIDVDVALTELVVNQLPLVLKSDGTTISAAVAFNAAGLVLSWNFINSAGAYTKTNVVPTDTAGLHDWVAAGDGMYTIEVPASGGTINNNAEGTGWFTGVTTAEMAWSSPIYRFRAAAINDLLCDSPLSATRGLAGTALPDAASNAPGGLPVSAAGALSLDSVLSGNVPQTGDSYLRLGANGAGLTAVPWNVAWDAEVQSECSDALSLYAPNTIAPLDAAGIRAAIGMALANMDTQLAAILSSSGGSGPQVLVSTTIASLTSQTVLTLTAGSPDDLAYANQLVIFTDQTTPVQKAYGLVNGYVGASLQLTLFEAPSFTLAIGDSVSIVAVTGSATALEVDANGLVSLAPVEHTGAIVPTVNAIAGTIQTLDTLNGAIQTAIGLLENLSSAEAQSAAAAAITASAEVAALPTRTEVEARTPSPAQLAYITANSATAVPVTFTTAGGTTTAAVLNLVDGAAPSTTNAQYQSKLIQFTSGTLKGVITDITAYAGATGIATITAVPFAPDATHQARMM